MSTLRVSNIEAKADVSSPSVHEKVKVTNSQGDVLIHIDGSTSGITTVGITTTEKTFDVDAAQNVTFVGDVSTPGNISVGGTLTYDDVTNVDSIGVVTARSGVHFGTAASGILVVGDSDGIGIGTDNPTELVTVGTAITTALFEVKPHSSGFDVNVTSGNFHPHYQNNFSIYNGQPGSGQQRLKLTSEGYLTVPNQPAFFAHGIGSDVTVNIGSKFAFNQTRFNRGSHYSTTNYNFTAPVAGVYCFQCQVWAKNGSNNARTRFYKNGTARSQNGFHAGTVSNANDHCFEMSILEDMAVGDTMDIRPDTANLTYYSGNANEVHTYFTGFLVG